MTVQRVTKAFFWLAFAAFLSASIPHVSYFFRAFEPTNDNQDTLWWIVSYGIAVSIDVTIYLLSITVSQMHRQNKPALLLFSVWVFIVGLTALSWYINGLYAQHFHSTTMLSDTTSFTLPLVGDINPLIASCFQVLVIAYTWIADKIGADIHIKTAKELEEQANAQEEINKQKERLANLNKQKFTGGLNTFVDGVISVGKHIAEAVKTEPEVTPIQVSPNVPSPTTQTPEAPTVTCGTNGNVDAVQFPGKDPVTIHPVEQAIPETPATQEDVRTPYTETPETPGDIHTDKLEAVGVSSNGNGHSKEGPQLNTFVKYVPKWSCMKDASVKLERQYKTQAAPSTSKTVKAPKKKETFTQTTVEEYIANAAPTE